MGDKKMVTTLCFLRDGERILLGLKKQGFGVGLWNGIGGKVDEGESIRLGMVRELSEEIGVMASPDDLIPAATISLMSKNEGMVRENAMHVFLLDRWIGEPRESQEMVPRWFPQNAIPYDRMWADDPYWLPLILEGKNVEASFSFDEKGTLEEGFTVRAA